jgi:Amt family ammonium transporter
MTRPRLAALVAAATALLAIASTAPGAEPAPSAFHPHGGGSDLDLAWVVLAAALVFLMQPGFAMLEAGFVRAKNAVNILMKNLMDVSVGVLVFWAVGFALMFGPVGLGGLAGTGGFFLAGEAPGRDGTMTRLMGDPWTPAFFLFQALFAATAATITSGAVAERIRFRAYLVYSVAMIAFIYPVFGSWAWGGLFSGGGWLEARPGGLLESWGLPAFKDFAGSTVVHSVGGWAALAGAIVVGPRRGRFSDGRVTPIPGHSMPLSALGLFLLWFGFFGFNAGSTLGFGHGRPGLVAFIALNTNVAAAAGALGATAASWWLVRKPDPGLALNGALAGLVAITAGCAHVEPWGAACIGAVAGCIVVAGVLLLDRLQVDDPVGAVSVHGFCGVWGTLALALFDRSGEVAFLSQLVGVLAAFLWAFPASLVLFLALKRTIGLRAHPEDEDEGLDLAEHAAEAYHRLEPR